MTITHLSKPAVEFYHLLKREGILDNPEKKAAFIDNLDHYKNKIKPK